jgi:hypothetical protein
MSGTQGKPSMEAKSGRTSGDRATPIAEQGMPGAGCAWIEPRFDRTRRQYGLPRSASVIALLLAIAVYGMGVTPSAAALIGAFNSSVASTGVIPDITDINSDGNAIILDTDNGDIYTFGYPNSLVTPLAGQSDLVSQSNGSSVMVFNFTSFTVPTGTTVLVQGSRPAVISATGPITIDGLVDASPDSWCLFSGGSGCTPRDRPGAPHGEQHSQGIITAGGGGGAPGTSGNYASGYSGGSGNPVGPSTGGGGGEYGIGNRVPMAGDYEDCCGQDLTGGGGGGGGSVSPGTTGGAGTPLLGYQQAAGGKGGNADKSLHVLQGGGGGGSGGTSDNGSSGQGGGGGGGVMFVTPGNLTIGTSGAISADGADGASYGTQAGGGGGGGMLWFDVGDTMTDDGVIAATGGEGGLGSMATNPFSSRGYWSYGGSGSGGEVDIDPVDFILGPSGSIDVAGGDGLGSDGGAVFLNSQYVEIDGTITGLNPTVAPEPGSIGLFAASLGILSLLRSRRRVQD